MWTPLRKEIEQIRKDLGLTDAQFRPLGLHDWQAIEGKIFQTFCKPPQPKSKPIWLWEYFKLDTASIAIERPNNFLDKLIDDHETVWFFVNETVNEAGKFWLYQGQVKAIQAIIEEASLLDEMYLGSKKYDWLLCINHHDILVATGGDMPDKLRQLGFPTQKPPIIAQ
jgi:hypothetical protein